MSKHTPPDPTAPLPAATITGDLAELMRAAYGPGPYGHIDTARAATELGVSRRSVQRWLHHDLYGTGAGGIPPARLADLRTALHPSEWQAPHQPAAALTGQRLLTALQIRFPTHDQGQGRGRGTRVDTAALAATHQVSRRSAQRWLHALATDTTVGLPPARQAALLADVRPPQSLLQDEARKARNAARALSRLELGRGQGIREEWRRARWLDEHLVLITEIPETPLRHVSTTRADRRRLDKLAADAHAVDLVVVANRFEADLVKAWVLAEVHPARVIRPASPGARRSTETWLAPVAPRPLELLPRRSAPPGPEPGAGEV